MTRRSDLPDDLIDHPFSVGAAHLNGVSPGRLRAEDLVAPFRGVRIPRDSDLSDLASRCRSLLPLLRPDEFFSHDTALALWGAPVFPDTTVASEEDHVPLAVAPLHISVFPPHRATRLRGVRSHQLRPGLISVEHRAGLPVCDPLSAWIQSATVAPARELVISGDALCLSSRAPLNPTPALLRVEDFAERSAVTQQPGVRRARLAAGLIRDGAESRMETLLRLTLVAAGLPEPELQVTVRKRDGAFLGRFDLAYPERNVLIEYDGDQHRTSRRQFVRDVTRIEEAQALGYRVIRVLAHELLNTPRDLIDRVRQSLGTP